MAKNTKTRVRPLVRNKENVIIADPNLGWGSIDGRLSWENKVKKAHKYLEQVKGWLPNDSFCGFEIFTTWHDGTDMRLLRYVEEQDGAFRILSYREAMEILDKAEALIRGDGHFICHITVLMEYPESTFVFLDLGCKTSIHQSDDPKFKLYGSNLYIEVKGETTRYTLLGPWDPTANP